MIRKEIKKNNDSQRSFQNGGTALVIGRSITDGNIKNNIKKIIKELE